MREQDGYLASCRGANAYPVRLNGLGGGHKSGEAAPNRQEGIAWNDTLRGMGSADTLISKGASTDSTVGMVAISSLY